MLYKLIASLVDCQQGTCVRLYQTIRSYKKTADTDSEGHHISFLKTGG